MLEGWFSGSSLNAVLNNLMKHDWEVSIWDFSSRHLQNLQENWILHRGCLYCITVVNQMCALWIPHDSRNKKRNLANKLFSTICICIIICILIDYRDLGRRHCTKENYIPNQFQSSWWGTDMEFLFCVSSSASRYAAEITDTHFKPKFD